jgi:type IV pilus modification protein PilV
MKLNKGFSLIEVMVALAVVAGLGNALYRLQLSSTAIAHQVITRQLIAMYTDDLVSKMNAQVNFVSLQDKDDAMTSAYLEAGSYGIHENAYIPQVKKSRTCTEEMCTEAELSAYYNAEWEQEIKTNVHLGENGNFRATICRDSAMKAPFFDRNDPDKYDPNCDNGEFNPMIVKISWSDGNENDDTQKLLRDDNYMLFRVAGR